MTEREKVLMQREAVRQFITSGPTVGFGFLSESTEARIRALFPLPPKREPRVVRDQHGDDWRLNEAHALERRLNMDGAPGWFVWANTARVAIIRDLLASPYIEVPDPEDAE